MHLRYMAAPIASKPSELVVALGPHLHGGRQNMVQERGRHAVQHARYPRNRAHPVPDERQ
jgi:hypothetical protein